MLRTVAPGDATACPAKRTSIVDALERYRNRHLPTETAVYPPVSTAYGSRERIDRGVADRLQIRTPSSALGTEGSLSGRAPRCHLVPRRHYASWRSNPTPSAHGVGCAVIPPADRDRVHAPTVCQSDGSTVMGAAVGPNADGRRGTPRTLLLGSDVRAGRISIRSFFGVRREAARGSSRGTPVALRRRSVPVREPGLELNVRRPEIGMVIVLVQKHRRLLESISLVRW